jgi:hypothetical protein
MWLRRRPQPLLSCTRLSPQDGATRKSLVGLPLPLKRALPL